MVSSIVAELVEELLISVENGEWELVEYLKEAIDELEDED